MPFLSPVVLPYLCIMLILCIVGPEGIKKFVTELKQAKVLKKRHNMADNNYLVLSHFIIQTLKKTTYCIS